MHRYTKTFADIQNECQREGTLFQDPDFEACDKSLFFSRPPPRPFVWKRPKEINENAKMIVGGASRLDIDQGYLGDCWLLAGFAGLCGNQALFEKVVIPGQDFDDPNYAGVVHFKFWQYGEWVDVCIDDLLPTYNNKLVFVHSKENEFWSALLEKAYAKLHGGYEALKGGQTSEALEDLTGGITEAFTLKDKTPDNLFEMMLKNIQLSCMMGCSINATAGKIEEKMDNGLVKGHAYTITDVKKVQFEIRGREIEEELVRIRNPWGNEREWTGAWGDQSSEWSMIPDDEKERLGLTFSDDGEFWMSFRDFKNEYDRLEVCLLSAECLAEDGNKNAWESRLEKGRWIRGATAGGCRNFPNTFHTNPQFRLTLTDPDDDEDDLCTVIIALMQKDRRKKKSLGAQMLTMGYAVYKLDEEAAKMRIIPKDYFLYHASAARSDTFINTREITSRHKLPPGEYVIIPSTFDPNQEGEFIVRIFSEKAAETNELGAKTEMVVEPKRPIVSREQHAALNDKFYSTFLKLAGGDEQIDLFELQQILTSSFKEELGGDKEFSLEATRSAIALMDADETGKLGFDEFKELWLTLRTWRQKFGKYDRDGSLDMDMYELRQALVDATGINVSNSLLTAIAIRFKNQRNVIDFDSFLQICVRVQLLMGIYKANFQNIDLTIKHGNRRVQYHGCAIFGLDEFFTGVMSL